MEELLARARQLRPALRRADPGGCRSRHRASGIKLLLERQPGLEVVAEAANGAEAVEQALAAREDGGTPSGERAPQTGNA